MSVELQSGSFYACYEEAITEYSAQVNQFNIKDNLLHLTGQATGSNVTHKRVTPTMGRSVFLAKQYGTEAGVGGNVDIKKASISVSSGSQEYDLNNLVVDGSGSGSIEVKRVYYEGTPAMQRFFDPYATTGYGTINMVQKIVALLEFLHNKLFLPLLNHSHFHQQPNYSNHILDYHYLLILKLS
jgi:hypothetical protein